MLFDKDSMDAFSGDLHDETVPSYVEVMPGVEGSFSIFTGTKRENGENTPILKTIMINPNDIFYDSRDRNKTLFLITSTQTKFLRDLSTINFGRRESKEEKLEVERLKEMMKNPRLTQSVLINISLSECDDARRHVSRDVFDVGVQDFLTFYKTYMG